MATPYPLWRFFPAYAPPPDWAEPVVKTFRNQRKSIDSRIAHATRMESNLVLAEVAGELEDLGFQVEKGKKKLGTLPRPVFFGALEAAGLSER